MLPSPAVCSIVTSLPSSAQNDAVTVPPTASVVTRYCFCHTQTTFTDFSKLKAQRVFSPADVVSSTNAPVSRS